MLDRGTAHEAYFAWLKWHYTAATPPHTPAEGLPAHGAQCPPLLADQHLFCNLN